MAPNIPSLVRLGHRLVVLASLAFLITATLGCTSPAKPPTPSHAAGPLPPFAGAGHKGVISTVHPLASDAGVAAMRRGGNAIDAAVAAALTLGVVDGHNSGIGGGCFMLIRRADGTVLAIDGREIAPAAARRDMFLKDGKPIPGASTTGPLAIGVPGSLAAYDYALRHGGRLQLADLLTPAADLAERGFPIDAAYANRLRETAPDLARFPASAAIFLDPSGKPRPRGHVLRQPDLASTYRAIAADGVDWFYRGPFARDVGEWMRTNGGIVTADDFSHYEILRREPLITMYHGYGIVGFPPPSSGGVHVAEILNILDSFDLKALDRADPAIRRHVIAEAMKLAFADRAFWLGDPAFARVPRGLIEDNYARRLARRINVSSATAVAGPGEPPAAAVNYFDTGRAPDADPTGGKHTTHIAAADSEGNWVALTTTVNTTFGSKVVVPGTGVVLNNQMDDFSIQPGAPNAFGLVGAEANAVAPGKRPLSSMSPTIVLKVNTADGRLTPILTCGAAGGPMIISQVVQVIVNHLDLGMPLPEAVAAPRIHHQWRPDVLYVEPTVDAAVVARLKALGHTVQSRHHIAAGQAIVQGEDGTLLGVHDPRVEGKVAAIDR